MATMSIFLFPPVVLGDGLPLVHGLGPGAEEVFVVVVEGLQVEVQAVVWSLEKWREDRGVRSHFSVQFQCVVS